MTMKGTTTVQQPFAVLFVCTANLCRSPLAEHILRSKLTDRGIQWRVTSAGAAANPGTPILPATASILREWDIDTSDWRTRRLTPEGANAADLILTADADRRRAVVSLAPRTITRTFTLLEFARLLRLAALLVPPHPAESIGAGLIDAAAAGRAAPQSRELHDTDIKDPINQPKEHLRRTAKTIAAALDQVLESVRQG